MDIDQRTSRTSSEEKYRPEPELTRSSAKALKPIEAEEEAGAGICDRSFSK